MKRTISILVLIAMMLASVLAILPVAAEEAAEGGATTATRKNVLFSDEDAANYQFAGKGNVFYFDYHYYTAAHGQTWPIANKSPSMRHGNNSGSGSASATDGVKFSGKMDHDFSASGATIELSDGTTATHNHIFGYSFKESVTIDGFKLWASTSEKTPVNRVTVYGAVVDPAKVEAAAATPEEYHALTYCYAAPTLLFEMEDGEDIQDNVEVENGKEAAVVAGDFDAIKIDYILIGVDFGDEMKGGDYTVYEVEAYEGSLVKDPATAVLGDVLYTVNFNGDDVFTPGLLDTNDEMDYIVSEDGRSVTIKGKEGGNDKKCNMWGGDILGLTATLQDVYTLRYKAKANSEAATSKEDAQNNSVGVGAWKTNDPFTNGKTPFYNNYANHNTCFGNDVSMRRSSISWANVKYGDGDLNIKDEAGNALYPKYVYWEEGENALANEYAIDSEGFMDMLMVYDGPAGTMSTYVLDETGAWMFIESVNELKKEGTIGFYTYAHYKVVNTTIKDARIYKGDFTKYIPPEVEEATEDELASLKYYIDQAKALTEANYTVNSWKKLKNSLDKAIAIYDADVKPKADVVSCTTILINNIGKLEADTSALKTLVDDCRKLSKNDYTKDSWATFDAAYSAAKNNESVAYEDVKALYDALVAAKAALVLETADKTELEKLITLAGVLKAEDFAEDDWDEFTTAVESAKAVFDAEDVTVSAVADAVKALTRAIKTINGGVLPPEPEEEKPTEKPTEEATEKPTEKPTEAATAAPTEPATTPVEEEGGCGGIIGASAVVVAVVLGAVVLKKKED